MHICVYQCTDVLGCRSNVNDNLFWSYLQADPRSYLMCATLGGSWPL